MNSSESPGRKNPTSNPDSAKTIVLARFVPIVRTFAPIVAGVSEMNYRTFVTYNVVGGVMWGIGITMLGYFLGQVSLIADHLEVAVLTLVALSLLPIVLEVVKSRRERSTEAASQ